MRSNFIVVNSLPLARLLTRHLPFSVPITSTSISLRPTLTMAALPAAIPFTVSISTSLRLFSALLQKLVPCFTIIQKKPEGLIVICPLLKIRRNVQFSAMNKVVYRHRSGGVFKNIVNFVAEQIQSIMRFRIKFKECMIKGIHIFDKNSSPVNFQCWCDLGDELLQGNREQEQP